MQNIYPERDLEDIVGNAAKSSAQSTTALEKATWIYEVISSKGKEMRERVWLTFVRHLLDSYFEYSVCSLLH